MILNTVWRLLFFLTQLLGEGGSMETDPSPLPIPIIDAYALAEADFEKKNPLQIQT